MVWDYHVVLVQSGGGSGGGGGDGGGITPLPLVWDLDTKLPFPVPLERYAAEALKAHLGLAPRYARCGGSSYRPGGSLDNSLSELHLTVPFAAII